MENLILSLYTPESKVVDKVPVREVLVPSHRGQLGILPGHAALISLLDAGVLKYWKKQDIEPEKIAVGWGYLEISKEEIRVLAETAQTKKALDQNKLEKDLQETLAELQNTEFDFEKRQELEKQLKRLRAEKELIS